ncbi:hypothetical protein ACLB2K_053832 [Fragaria x ananassa]
MAIFLRRGFSLRNALLRRIPALCGTVAPPQRITLSTPPPAALEFVRESRRGFAKGRNKSSTKSRIVEDEDSESTVEVLPDMGPTIKANATTHMEAAITALLGELSKLRTGRASPGMLDHIIVEASGLKLPLSQIAVVSVMDSKTLSINPFDPNALKNIETAIIECPLGLNPKTDGDRLIAAIPPLTKEHVQAICKVVNKSCEDGRLSIRRGRQKAMDAIKKLYSIYPKDDLKRLEKEVEELTKKYIKKAEDLCKAKEKEIAAGAGRDVFIDVLGVYRGGRWRERTDNQTDDPFGPMEDQVFWFVAEHLYCVGRRSNDVVVMDYDVETDERVYLLAPAVGPRETNLLENLVIDHGGRGELTACVLLISPPLLVFTGSYSRLFIPGRSMAAT